MQLYAHLFKPIKMFKSVLLSEQISYLINIYISLPNR